MKMLSKAVKDVDTCNVVPYFCNRVTYCSGLLCYLLLLGPSVKCEADDFSLRVFLCFVFFTNSVGKKVWIQKQCSHVDITSF